MCLFNDYGNIEKFNCYDSNATNPFKIKDFNNPITSLEFISEYFAAGRKLKAFDLGFENEFNINGKHQHTVALYFLGLKLKDIIENQLEQFLEKNVKNIKGTNGSDSWYNFLYTWFLTCLYHDTASVIEKSEYKNQPIDFFLGANNVSHNVFYHKPILPYTELFTYSEGLVRNYFDYCISHCLKVDHGILGGILLFDRLRKNYDNAWRDYSLSEDYKLEHSYEYFEYKERKWRIEHLDHFAIIADSVIAHNIWFSADKKLYEHYGLTPLIISRSNKIESEKRPLLFFLGLLDTMEPVKFFTSDENCQITPLDTLKNIDIALVGCNEIVIKIKEGFVCSNLRKKWFEKIKSMEDWLNVSVCEKGSNFCNLTITIKCGIDNTGKHCA